MSDGKTTNSLSKLQKILRGFFKNAQDDATRDALLHGRQVLVIHTGDIPYGSNLVGVIIQNEPA